MQNAPATYRVNANFASDELDYADMIELSETFIRWALEETKFSPAQRTGLMEMGIDYENLAEWVGPGWKAANPSDEPNPLRAIAELVRPMNAEKPIMFSVAATLLMVAFSYHTMAQRAPSQAEIAAYEGLHRAAHEGDVMSIERLVREEQTQTFGMVPAERLLMSPPLPPMTRL